MGSQVVDARDDPVGEVGFLSCRGGDRPSGSNCRWGGQADYWGSQEGVDRDAPAEEEGRGAVAGAIAPPGQTVVGVVK
jgi:hypothetical protein